MDNGPDDNDFGAYGAGGFSGDSPIDDSWTADATGITNGARRAAATEKALANEKSASGGASGGSLSGKNGNGISAAKNAESDASDKTQDGDKKSDFKNNVTGKVAEKAAGKAVPGGKILVKQAKKLGPLGVILVALGICMGLFSASQSLAPFGYVANALDQFNVLRTMMSKSTKQYGFFTLGTTDNTASSSNRLLTGHIAGWYDTSSVNLHRFRIRFNRNKYEGSDKNTASDSEIVDASKRGGLDEDLGEVRKGNGENQKETDIGKSKEDIEASFREEGTTIDFDDLDGVDMSTLEKNSGGLIDVDTDLEGGSTRVSDLTDTAAVSNNLSARATGAIASMGSKVGVYCGVVKAYAAIQAVFSGIKIAKILNFATTFLNAVQQAQAGDGGAALNYWMNEVLSKKGHATGITTSGEEVDVSDISSLESDAFNQVFSEGSIAISSDDPIATKLNKDRSAAAGFRESIFSTVSEAAINSPENNNWKVKLAAFLGAINAYPRDWGTQLANATELYKSCVLAQETVDMAAVGADLIKLALAIFSSGSSLAVGALADGIKEALFKITLGVLVGGLIGAVMGTIVPKLAKWMAKDYLTEAVGEESAYAILDGISAYTGKQMQQSSGLPGTEEQVVAQYRETQIVIAEEAEYQRSIRSPFDPTSKYTFLGSIVNTLTPIANSLSSPLSIVSGTMQTVGSAITSLKPTAAAESETVFKGSLNKNCPGLSEMEGHELVGDAFCNPYFVSDYETLTSDSPYASISEVEAIDSGAFDYSNSTVSESGEEIPAIASGSELSKWALACTQRESQFGTVDSTVANALELIKTGKDTVDTILTSGLENAPYVGDFIQLIEDVTEQSNLPWTTGEACLSEEAMVYSRYSEDQRWLESAGEIEQSAVAAFVEDYYEKNPVDNSLSGVIARFSGMSKEMTEDTLAIIEYIDYIAEYDPTDTWPLGVQEAYTYLYESGNATENEDLGENVVPVKRVIYENFGANTTLV